MRLTARRRAALAVAGVAVACYLGAAFAFARHVDRERLPQARYDAAAVLFGDFGDRGGLSRESWRRVHRALALYRAGRAGRIACVGGGRPSAPVKGADLMCRALEAAGVPASALTISATSLDTNGNLRDLAALARAQGWRQVALVSAPTHLHRIEKSIGSGDAGLAWAYAPYRLAAAEPAIGALELLAQVSYEWALALAQTVLSPAQVSALAARLRR